MSVFEQPEFLAARGRLVSEIEGMTSILEGSGTDLGPDASLAERAENLEERTLVIRLARGLRMVTLALEAIERSRT